MRLATWNLESYRNITPERAEQFRRAMEEVNADIWVLTETWRDFSPGVGYSLLAQSSKAEDLAEASKRCWVSIWVKSEIGNQSQEVCSQPDRMARGRIEISPKQDLAVVGTVLPWGNDKLFPGAKGFCDAVTEQEIDWTLRAGSTKSSVYIVAGDFNQSIPYQRYYGSKIGAEMLDDVLRKHDLECLTRTTNLLPNVSPAIDHIFVRPCSTEVLTISSIETWETPLLEGKPITDHRGVFIELEIH